MSSRKQSPQIPADVRLKLPCELVTEHFLPIVRRLLANELVKEHGVSQAQVARALGVTQPAVSNYLSSELRLRRPRMAEGLEDTGLTVKALAEDLLNDRLTQVEAMGRICGLCTRMRNRGPLCAVHGEDVPTIQPDRCSFCLEDIADIRYMTLGDHRIVEGLRRAVQMIESTDEMAALIPEIGMNIVYAKPGASAMEEVVGVPGRIRPIRGTPRASSAPEFGGSSHVSRAALTVMRHEPSMLSAISLKFDWDLVEICREIGLTVSFFDRSEEPPEVKRVDGRTIPWGVSRALEGMEKAPDVVYDLGDIGKEPMIFLFGRSPQEVARQAIRIATEYAERRN